MNFKGISYCLNRHFREACPRPDRGAGIQENQGVMDSCFRRNDKYGAKRTFYETINPVKIILVIYLFRSPKVVRAFVY